LREFDASKYFCGAPFTIQRIWDTVKAVRAAALTSPLLHEIAANPHQVRHRQPLRVRFSYGRITRQPPIRKMRFREDRLLILPMEV